MVKEFEFQQPSEGQLQAWTKQYGEVDVVEVRKDGQELGKVYFKPPQKIADYRTFMGRFLGQTNLINRGELVFNSSYLGGVSGVEKGNDLPSELRDTQLFVEVCLVLEHKTNSPHYAISFTKA